MKILHCRTVIYLTVNKVLWNKSKSNIRIKDKRLCLTTAASVNKIYIYITMWHSKLFGIGFEIET